MLFAAGSEGFFFGIGSLPVISRACSIAAALMLLDPDLKTDLMALGLVVLAVGVPALLRRLRRSTA